MPLIRADSILARTASALLARHAAAADGGCVVCERPMPCPAAAYAQVVAAAIAPPRPAVEPDAPPSRLSER
ncbi:hypothetical protein AB0M46_48565 [Dactylosporangium sp. NPDC051485]|uniref:hypothetical protein n=1 Tax=Dactylosporangium sp. NPDC051485 TaxID=3154846 RepID=UPI003426010B